MKTLTAPQLQAIISRVTHPGFRLLSPEKQGSKVAMVYYCLREERGLISPTEEAIAAVIREMIEEGEIER